MWVFGDRTIGDVVLGTQEMSCVEHRRCPAWNIGDVLLGMLGAQELSCAEHKTCPARNMGIVLLGTQKSHYRDIAGSVILWLTHENHTT